MICCTRRPSGPSPLPHSSRRVSACSAPARAREWGPTIHSPRISPRLSQADAVVIDHADPDLSRSPRTRGESAVRALLEAEPTLVVAVDFVFWFAHTSRLPRARRDDVDQALALLDHFEGRLVAGDLAALDTSTLPAAQRPGAEEVAALNARIHAWAEERSNVSIVELSGEPHCSPNGSRRTGCVRTTRARRARPKITRGRRAGRRRMGPRPEAPPGRVPWPRRASRRGRGRTWGEAARGVHPVLVAGAGFSPKRGWRPRPALSVERARRSPSPARRQPVHARRPADGASAGRHRGLGGRAGASPDESSSSSAACRPRDVDPPSWRRPPTLSRSAPSTARPVRRSRVSSS